MDRYEPEELESRVEEEKALQWARREAKRRLDAEGRAAVAPPEVLTLRERLARPRAPTRHRIEGWMPEGARVVLAAQFKAGKTTAVGNLVRCLLDGDSWLGHTMTNPVAGAVVVLDFEMSPNQTEDWLAGQKIRNDDRLIPVNMRGAASAFDILDTAVRSEWAARLRERGCAFLVLDCLRPVLDALGLDEHRDAGRFLVAFDAMLSEAGVPEAMVVHHMGHANERSRGDSRIRDWPDVEWRLVRQDDDPASPRFVSAFGRDVDMPESRLNYDATTRRLTLVAGTRAQARQTAEVGPFVDYVRTHPGCSGNEIERDLGWRNDRLVKVRQAAEGAGLTRREDQGPGRAHAHHVVAPGELPTTGHAPVLPMRPGAVRVSPAGP